MRFIDISHPLNSSTPSYPGDPALRITQEKSLAQDGYCLHALSSGLHSGTHVDVPMHLLQDGRTVAEFSLDAFAGQGALLDVRGEREIGYKPQYERLIQQDSVVLLFTGHDAFYGTDRYYDEHPTITLQLASFFISRHIRMLGFDMPSPDHAPYIVHKHLLAHDILLLENITNLAALLDVPSFEVLALPLKIQAEASFVRAACQVK